MQTSLLSFLLMRGNSSLKHMSVKKFVYSHVNITIAKLILQLFLRIKISITKGPPAHIMDKRMYLSTDQFLLVHGGLQLSMASPTAKPVMLQGGLPILPQWGKKPLNTKNQASTIISKLCNQGPPSSSLSRWKNLEKTKVKVIRSRNMKQKIHI